MAQNNLAFAPAWIVAQRDERSFGRSRIVFSQSTKNQSSAALAMAPGPWARIASIVWRSGRVSAFQKR